AGEIVSDVKSWLDEHGAQRFFLYLHLGDPHEYRPSDSYRARFAGTPPEGFSMPEFRRLNEESRAGLLQDDAQLESFVKYMSGLYDGAVAEGDEAFGGLLSALE